MINEVVYTRFKSADTIVTQRFNYTLYENGEEMLYNLKSDPGENVNRASDPEYKHNPC